MPRASVTRKVHFNAAHRVHNPKFSDQWNREMFGECNNPNYHGHNYELELTVETEANQYIPFALEEVNLDFQVLGPSPATPDEQEVLIAATRKEKVEDRVAVAESAGLKALVMDVESFAQQAALSLVVQSLPGAGKDQNVAVVDVGANVMNVTVLRNDELSRSILFATPPVHCADEPEHPGIGRREVERRLLDLAVEEDRRRPQCQPKARDQPGSLRKESRRRQAEEDARGRANDGLNDANGKQIAAEQGLVDEFLVHTREGEPCPRCGRPIRKLRAAGRGTYVCEGCQPRPRRA